MSMPVSRVGMVCVPGTRLLRDGREVLSTSGWRGTAYVPDAGCCEVSRVFPKRGLRVYSPANSEQQTMDSTGGLDQPQQGSQWGGSEGQELVRGAEQQRGYAST